MNIIPNCLNINKGQGKGSTGCDFFELNVVLCYMLLYSRYDIEIMY